MPKEKTQINSLTRKFEAALKSYAPMEHCEHENLVVDYLDMNEEEGKLYNELAQLLIKNRLPKKFSEGDGDLFYAPICICVSE